MKKRRARYLHEHQAEIPRIHQPERWWSTGNLMQLVCLRRTISNYVADPHHHDLLKMGVLGILVPLSNARHNHVSLTFAAAPAPTMDVAAILAAKYREMIEDLRSVAVLPRSEVVVYRGNSKEPSAILPVASEITAVITSPPYPNRFSYAERRGPISSFSISSTMRRRSAGSRPRRSAGPGARRRPCSPRESLRDADRDDAGSVHQDHRRNGSLMASYINKYFNDMVQHAGEIAKVCAAGAAWRT